MDPDFRQLDDRERGLIDKLLETDFLGRDELISQLASVTAKQIHEDGTLTLRCGSGLPSPSKYRLVAEAWCKDADGMTISIMLHISKDRFMCMLEIYKYDQSEVINAPRSSDLVLLPPEDGEIKT
ncbi:MAG: hypothetical protein WB729_01140 [Candidatus Sulfotelmatobacter sp.]